MATYTGYSEQELKDKAYVLRRCCVTEEDMPMFIEIFSNPETLYSEGILTLTPKSRCSDGKLRSFYEYIDFLFPTPTIEEIVEASNTPNRIFRTSLDFSIPNMIKVRMNRI